jgi:hypothetical protein
MSDYFDKFQPILKTYLPIEGEGETMATQIVTAVNKLIYKWFNDGDVYDNRYYMEGWLNDLSSYANWLYGNITGVSPILEKIKTCHDSDEYENILKELADYTLNEDFLGYYAKLPSVESIYDYEIGPYKFVDERGEEDEEYLEEED